MVWVPISVHSLRQI